MRLTCKGFLLAYCQELSGLQTTSIKKLAAAAAGEAPRVAEPLFLYALEAGKLALLLKSATGTWMEQEFEGLATAAAEYAGDAQGFLQAGSVPQRYTQVLSAYEARRQRTQADRRVIALMREKTLEGLGRSGVTCYRLCEELGLNKGNVYAYLNKGDLTKVSRATARRIMQFATG